MLIFLNETEHKDGYRNTRTVFLLHCPPTLRIVLHAWVEFGRMNLLEGYGPALMK